MSRIPFQVPSFFKNRTISYFWQRYATFMGTFLGIGYGYFYPQFVSLIALPGDLFVLLLKMILLPLVGTSIFVSLAQQTSVGALSKLGRKTAFFYLCTSALACLTGLLVAEFFLEGSSLFSEKVVTKELLPKLADWNLFDYFKTLIPESLFGALSRGEVLPVVFTSVLFGLAATRLEGPAKDQVVTLARGLNEIIMIVMSWLLFTMPIGVFSLLAVLVAKTEAQVFLGLGPFFLATGLTCFIHFLINLPLLAWLAARINIYHYYFRIRDALLLALTSASSSASLPVSTAVSISEGGVDRETAGFVLPLGATLNMDGSALYQALVVIYLGNLAGLEFVFTQKLMIFGLVMLSSAGSAGIPGGGVAMLTAVLQILGVPLEYLGIYLLVDRFWDYPITAVNVAGDLVVAKIVSQTSRVAAIEL